MHLDPHEVVEAELIFNPRLYDSKEFAFLKRNLFKGDVFLDIGASIGTYTVVASSLVGPNGSVVAIEPVPETFQILHENVCRNNMANVTTRKIALSEVDTLREMSVSIRSDELRYKRGLSSLVRMKPSGETILVECLTLTSLLRQLKISQIAGLKIDIEGSEYSVLRSYFESTPQCQQRPRFIICEQNPRLVKKGEDVKTLVEDNGYRAVYNNRSSNNFIFIQS